ncbi:MAG: ADP-ribosylation factor-like protein [Promethearchaeota archaeon]
MPKKLILVGPSGVGKSTLRKWLFEGEDALKLLENPLEPTYGFENFSYRLFKNLGVFDLAGQEFERWFDEEQEIFDESDIIINVLDARTATKIITDYLLKALVLQKKHSPAANVFFLIHKLDLIDEIQKNKLQKALDKQTKKILRDYNFHVNWYFTSIKSELISTAINAFVDLIQKSGLASDSRLDTDLIRLNADLFELLIDKEFIPLDDFHNRLRYKFQKEPKEVQVLIDSYREARLLQYHEIDNSTNISLTEEGRAYYDNVLRSFEGLTLGEKVVEAIPVDEHKLPEFWIYGIMISDCNGKTLIIAETEGESLKDALNKANNPQFDLELIPMFLNAMSKFAEEINVQDLSSFRIQGANIKMSSLSKEDLTLTIFSHPDFRIDHLKNDFNRLFDEFLTQFERDIEIFGITGNATKFLQFVPEARTQIISVVEKYLRMEEDIAKFDVDKAKQLYGELNKIKEEDYSLEEQLRIKSLKLKLLETIIAEDPISYQEIEQEIVSMIN